MYNDLSTDSRLSPTSYDFTTTPFEFDPFCDINASLDNVMGLGASLANNPLFDCSLPDLGTCIPHPAMPTPVSLSCFTDSTSGPNKRPEAGPGAGPRRQISSEEYRAGQSNMQKGNRGVRGNKTKGSQRSHYAVEKRYRLTLNEKYAALERTLSSEPILRMCRTETQDGAPEQTDCSGKDNSGGSRQRKTATLSRTIDTINTLSRCCSREAKELSLLRSSVNDIQNRVRHVLEPRIEPDQEQSGGASL